jgi:hypothetical protein
MLARPDPPAELAISAPSARDQATGSENSRHLTRIPLPDPPMKAAVLTLPRHRSNPIEHRGEKWTEPGCPGVVPQKNDPPPPVFQRVVTRRGRVPWSDPDPLASIPKENVLLLGLAPKSWPRWSPLDHPCRGADELVVVVPLHVPAVDVWAGP